MAMATERCLKSVTHREFFKSCICGKLLHTLKSRTKAKANKPICNSFQALLLLKLTKILLSVVHNITRCHKLVKSLNCKETYPLLKKNICNVWADLKLVQLNTRKVYLAFNSRKIKVFVLYITLQQNLGTDNIRSVSDRFIRGFCSFEGM